MVKSNSSFAYCAGEGTCLCAYWPFGLPVIGQLSLWADAWPRAGTKPVFCCLSLLCFMTSGSPWLSWWPSSATRASTSFACSHINDHSSPLFCVPSLGTIEARLSAAHALRSFPCPSSGPVARRGSRRGHPLRLEALLVSLALPQAQWLAVALYDAVVGGPRLRVLCWIALALRCRRWRPKAHRPVG